MYKENKIDDNTIKKITFLAVADITCLQRGIVYKFKCPLCGGIARAGKEVKNGHIVARCRNCEMDISE